jgi:FKBP-type peptidyl-prolyl cis-trans isomerase SlyD
MPAQVVSFRCVLKTTQGRIISSSVNQNVLATGENTGLPLGALGDALQDLRKGEKRSVSVSANKAYGFYNPRLVIVRSLDEISMSEPVKTGEQIVYVRDGNRGVFHVLEVSGDSVTLDGNHPLAGLDLVFELEGMDSREATAAELADSVEKEIPSPLH